MWSSWGWCAVNFALVKRIRLENSVMFPARWNRNRVKDTWKKKEVQSYLMAFPCEGSSGPDDHMTHPITPAPRCLGALQPPSPWQRGRSAAPCVCACVHVRKRSSSSELNSGCTWYSLDMLQSQITAGCYYIVCKMHLILTVKGKNSINDIFLKTSPLKATV